MYLYIGIVSGIVSVASFLAHYTFSGSQLVSASEAKKRIAKGAVVLDVRTKFEYGTGHHPGAKHVPPSQFETLKLRKDTDIVVYCNTGQRARAAAEKLKGLGYTNAVYIAGPYGTLR